MSIEDYIKQLHDQALYGRRTWVFDGTSRFTLNLGAVVLSMDRGVCDAPYLNVAYVTSMSKELCSAKDLIGLTACQYRSSDTVGVDQLYALLWSLRPPKAPSPAIDIKVPFQNVSEAFEYALKENKQ